MRRDETGINLTIVLYSRKTNKTAKICCIDNEWSNWEIDVKNSDIAGLSNPLQGTAKTFTIPPKASTVVNSLTLAPGTYILTAFAKFTTQFEEIVVYAITRNHTEVVTCRGTGAGGGGATPFTILKTNDTVEIQFVLYQDSSSDKNINANTLTALKLA